MAAATADERLKAIRALERSAEQRESGRPHFRAVAREIGWSSQTLSRWWSDKENIVNRAATAQRARLSVAPPPTAPEAPADDRARLVRQVRAITAAALRAQSFVAAIQATKLEIQLLGLDQPPDSRPVDPLEHLSDDELRAIVDGERVTG
jgi:transposase-like protein